MAVQSEGTAPGWLPGRGCLLRIGLYRLLAATGLLRCGPTNALGRVDGEGPDVFQGLLGAEPSSKTCHGLQCDVLVVQ
jgi:hypothetical protein